ncbi:hypothetical protein EB796_015993 [Bugula neritina]|uniref:Secreted protein n=1 Tax=Bugula neritina TaxID=10212 RepID=A0A7J7JHC2_BUGNE|nr:hypothetical protein EB796_015993 [Bugula neritina]
MTRNTLGIRIFSFTTIIISLGSGSQCCSDAMYFFMNLDLAQLFVPQHVNVNHIVVSKALRRPHGTLGSDTAANWQLFEGCAGAVSY